MYNNYVDPEHKITRTALHSYNYSLDQLGVAEVVKNVHGLQKAMKGYEGIMADLCDALLFGQAEAAGALAYLYYHGYGAKQDIYKVKLYIAIGYNLGSKLCTMYMQGKNDDAFDIAGFLQTRPVYSKDILDKAAKYANICRINATKYPKDQILTSELLVENMNIFNNVDPAHPLHPTDISDDESLGTKLMGKITNHCEIS